MCVHSPCACAYVFVGECVCARVHAYNHALTIIHKNSDYSSQGNVYSLSYIYKVFWVYTIYNCITFVISVGLLHEDQCGLQTDVTSQPLLV